ncbi:unnamed protein product [Ceutorhynchus assimilis]|uniref:Tyrosyl-DNA phosphodiesterase n=1 Tax=Ceutorhynchus assimilis TaxID=467358 RepID=A0A9N9MJL3_9CUCU|nr:unnamed protein product [Ceutorhynchus assimilis]
MQKITSIDDRSINNNKERCRDFSPNHDLGKGFVERYKASAPFHLFYTGFEPSQDANDRSLAINLGDLIHVVMGTIEHSLHVTYSCSVDWLISMYKGAHQNTRMTIIAQKFETCNSRIIPKNVNIYHISMPGRYSSAHAKFSIFIYSSGKMRIIVTSANFQESDWLKFANGVWVSPLLPRLPPHASKMDDESRTNFKSNLLAFLKEYGKYVENMGVNSRNPSNYALSIGTTSDRQKLTSSLSSTPSTIYILGCYSPSSCVPNGANPKEEKQS